MLILFPIENVRSEAACGNPWAYVRIDRQDVVQERFSHCDRITDKPLPILFPIENVRSEAACGNPWAYVRIDRQDGRHEFKGMLPLQYGTHRF